MNSNDLTNIGEKPERMHYARLYSVLSSKLNMSDLLAICTRLKLSLKTLNLPDNPPQKDLVLALSSRLHQEWRFEELFDTLNQLLPSIVQEWQQNSPSGEWQLPSKDFPGQILEKIDRLLGEKGEFHYGLEYYDEPTGCFCWSYPTPINQGLFPELMYNILERLQTHLNDEPVIAFVGQQSSYDMPYIVLAPTEDQFDIVRIAGTCGPMLEINPENIIDELLIINEKFGINILGANDRVVAIKLKREPQGIEKDEISQWFNIFPDSSWSYELADGEVIEVVFE